MFGAEGSRGRKGRRRESGRERGREEKKRKGEKIGQKIDMSSVGMVGRAHCTGTAAARTWEGTSFIAFAACLGHRAEAQDSVLPIAWAEESWGERQLPALDSGIWVWGSFFLRD